MKKHPGRIRWVSYEGDCYVNVDDIVEMYEKHNRKHNHPILNWLIDYYYSILRDWSNRVPGMPDDMKKDWTDIMKPN